MALAEACRGPQTVQGTLISWKPGMEIALRSDKSPGTFVKAPLEAWEPDSFLGL